MKKSEFKNFCIKQINGKFYVYSWCYRPKAYRTNKKKQRFHWKYRGKYGSSRVNKFLRTLSHCEQQRAKIEYEELQFKFEREQEMIKVFLHLEPYASNMNRIIKINNRKKREIALKKFYSEIKEIIKNHTQ